MQNAAPAVAGPSDPPPVYSTLLALVQSLRDLGSSEDEVVETAMQLVNGGRVVLTGNFKGCRLELGDRRAPGEALPRAAPTALGGV